MRFELGRDEKLKSEKDISHLFNRGKWGFVYPFKYVTISSGIQNNRMLISVPKKSHKHAVDRNRIKRLVRESYRTNKHKLTQCGIDIGFVYVSKNIESYSTVECAVKSALDQIQNTIKK